MRKVSAWILLSLLFFSCAAALAVDAGKLMRFADVHNEKVVFTYEGDLWLGSIHGGPARRLTRHEGGESWAKFSPDGTKIAFTGSYDGGQDVYVMDVQGGEPVRLTYHPAGDQVQEWFPDGEWILFRSRGRVYPSREYSLWKIRADGGMPEPLPVDKGGLATVSPDGRAVAYNPISREFATWKRYKGGMAMDIWVCRLEEGRIEPVTDYVGNDNWPMWINDEIYFASERSKPANIFKYSFETGKTIQVTRHQNYDVKYPSRGGPGDGTVIYQHGGELYLLDVNTGKDQRLRITIPSDRVPMRETRYPVTDYVGLFGLSPTGVRMVFDSRGDLFTVPAEKGTPRCLTEGTPASREKSPAWSPDGKWVAFYSDRTGEEELYLVDRKGDGEWIQLTDDAKGFRMQPVWSPDSTHLVFADKAMKLHLVDVEARIREIIDQGEVDTGWEDWGVQEYSFSPDGRWVVYTKVVESQLESVFLYSLDDKRVYPVTDPARNDFSPSFDPDGKYLYFLSDRTFNPIMGDLDQNHVYLNMTKPYVLILKAGEPSPFKPEEANEEVKEEKDEKEPGEGEAKEEGKKNDKVEKLAIDTKDFRRRIVEVPVPAGNYFRLEAVKGGFLYLSKEDQEFLKYQIVNDASGPDFDLHKFDMKSKKSTKIMDGIGNYHLSRDGKKMIYRAGSTFGVVRAGEKSSAGSGKVNLARVYGKVDKKAEFIQMFNEAWRIERDFFYDMGMHGVDWNTMREKYVRLVPHCGNRSDLNYLIGEMIGELNAGHTYVYGGDRGYMTDTPRVSVGLMGVDFDTSSPGDYYRIAAILPGDNGDSQYYSPLYAPDCGVEEGDYLIAVDGREVRKGDNVYARLEGKTGAIVTITYNTEPSWEGAKSYSFKPVGSERELRYRRWVENNRARVEKATRGRVAYMHIPDMMDRGLVEFAKVYYSQHYKKGLIIDDRYNGGGFTADMMLDRLERRLWSLTIPREGGILRNPENVLFGPMVLVINEYTGSNGEYFATAFRVKKMGKIVGMRTWGGAVGIEPHQDLADGGTVTPPQFAPYSPWTMEWYFEGRGVEPDVEVQNLPSDVLQGNDPQLDKAIEIVLGEVKKYYRDWDDLPPPPEYPDKR